MAGYYEPCEEFDICNRLIEKYWESRQFELCFQGYLKLAEEKPEKFIMQAEMTKQATVVYNKDSIKDIDVIAADQSESELKEVVHVIAPAQCLSYGEKTLEGIEPLTKAVSFS